jgi:TolA-binding protein
MGCTTREFRAAQEMLRQQKFYNAIELYLSFVREKPDHRKAPEALLNVGYIQENMLDEPKRALETYQTLVSRYPINKYTIAGQRRVAEIYKTHFSNYRQAVVEYEKLLHAAPEDPEAPQYQFEIARSYTLLHNYEQAAVEYENLLKTYPKYDELDEVYYQMGNNAYIGGKYSDAINAYKTALERFPKSKLKVQIIFSLGAAYEEMDDWENARAQYHLVENQYPSPKVVEIRLKGLAAREKKKSAIGAGAVLRR